MPFIIEEEIAKISTLTQRVDNLIYTISQLNLNQEEPYRGKREILEYLSVSENTFRKFIKQGMPIKRIGSHYRGKFSEIDRWINAQQKNKHVLPKPANK